MSEVDYKAYSIFILALQDTYHRNYTRYVKLDWNDVLFLQLHMYFIYQKYAARLIESQQ